MRQALQQPVQCCGWRKSSTPHTDRPPLTRTHRLICCQQPSSEQPTNPSEFSVADFMSQCLSRYLFVLLAIDCNLRLGITWRPRPWPYHSGIDKGVFPNPVSQKLGPRNHYVRYRHPIPHICNEFDSRTPLASRSRSIADFINATFCSSKRDV